MKGFIGTVLLLVLLYGCGQKVSTEDSSKHNQLLRPDAVLQVRTGIDVLKQQNFKPLVGKRVGLITNQTGVDAALNSSIDILFQASEVNLVALFGPEHGVRGDFKAGDKIANATDSKTGLPIYSLYGKTKKPTAKMLEGVDVLVYDIQDLGVRSYTFISTMGLAMEAAAENGVEFIVLDRPNPLGGLRVEGSLVEKEQVSFVSQFPIPYVYGLTAGELAVYLNEQGLLLHHIKCKLEVITMYNWKREMIFSDTGLPWVPTSPHIPRANSAFFYALSGIVGELDGNSIGVGYTLPFELFATQFANAHDLCDVMNSFNLSGVRFRPIHYKPYYLPNKGKEYAGVQVHITDYDSIRVTEVQFRFLEALHQLYPAKTFFNVPTSKLKMFDLVCGSKQVRQKFCENYKYDDIKYIWEAQEDKFREECVSYHFYL